MRVWMETPSAWDLWQGLERDCAKGVPGCEVLTIPHNSNISGNGLMFASAKLRTRDDLALPVDAEEARWRQRYEPVIEIMQHKGDSECETGVDTDDPLCNFENLPYDRFGAKFSWFVDEQRAEPPNFVRWALKDAGVEPSEVDYINAHGTGTPLGDVSETLAIKNVFGDHAYRVAISSSKSMIGHLWGAAGAVESIACVLSIRDNIIHPTINLETPDPDCDLDYVPNVARKAQVDIATCNSFGLGGQNACTVYGRYTG